MQSDYSLTAAEIINNEKAGINIFKLPISRTYDEEDGQTSRHKSKKKKHDDRDVCCFLTLSDVLECSVNM